MIVRKAQPSTRHGVAAEVAPATPANRLAPLLAALPAAPPIRTVDRGTVLLETGSPIDRFFVVTRGRLKLSRRLHNGRNVTLALVGPGDSCGLIAAMTGRPAEARVEAIEQTSCLEVSREAVLTAITASPERAAELLPTLFEPLTECGNCLVELSCYRIEARLGRLFVRLCDSIGEPEGDAVRIPMRLSRIDLAELVGTTVETSIRIMSQWGKLGWVETLPNGFLVRARDRLAALVYD